MEECEKYCVIMFDEMSIKLGLEYNSRLDLIEGYEDLSKYGRNEKIANHAMVFMVRGLFKNWKQPISYYISSGSISANILKKIVEDNLTKCFDIGLIINVIVCDQGPSNRRVYNMFGVTPEKPHIKMNNSKIFVVYDTPHLIKSVRNNLLTKDFFIENKRISWKDIVKTYNLNKSYKFATALTKITENHIRPNSFQKMKVCCDTDIQPQDVYCNEYCNCRKCIKNTNSCRYSLVYSEN